jgi:hypothetical protein
MIDGEVVVNERFLGDRNRRISLSGERGDGR